MNGLRFDHLILTNKLIKIEKEIDFLKL